MHEECLCSASIINRDVIRCCLNTAKKQIWPPKSRVKVGDRQPKSYCRRICWWVRGTANIRK